jgi:hypothetical protein
MGEYFLVIVFCIMGECTSIDPQTPYPDYNTCQEVSEETAVLFQRQYPNSKGQIYCLSEDEYKEYINTTEPKEAPKVGSPV